MHFDAWPLLTHVVHDPANERAGVIDGQRGALGDLAEVVEVIGPLLAIFELEGEDCSLAVFPFGLLGDAQPLGTLSEDLSVSRRRLVRLGGDDRNGGRSA